MSYMKNDYYVTYIDEERTANTYCMMQIIQDGCRRDIVQRMNFAKKMLKNLVDIEGADIWIDFQLSVDIYFVCLWYQNITSRLSFKKNWSKNYQNLDTGLKSHAE